MAIIVHGKSQNVLTVVGPPLISGGHPEKWENHSERIQPEVHASVQESGVALSHPIKKATPIKVLPYFDPKTSRKGYLQDDDTTISSEHQAEKILHQVTGGMSSLFRKILSTVFSFTRALFTLILDIFKSLF